ncbi:MAG: exodeoxyribonuclease VII small subunit [Lachnospiraceae bacterium]|nr:exodeoxyribonuclease VII small subunit [Lachnospiraceae bacterium]
MSSQEAIREEKELNLEEAFGMLEETVANLEREDISLEDSFLVYQKGMELLKKCNQAIDRIEKKVLVLEEDGETHEF